MFVFDNYRVDDNEISYDVHMGAAGLGSVTETIDFFGRPRYEAHPVCGLNVDFGHRQEAHAYLLGIHHGKNTAKAAG